MWVTVRIGAWDLEETVDGYNLGACIGMLRKGVLHRELNGEPITRKTMLKALASLNDKAVAFHKAHFAEMIVQDTRATSGWTRRRINRLGWPFARTRSCPYATSGSATMRWRLIWTRCRS